MTYGYAMDVYILNIEVEVCVYIIIYLFQNCVSTSFHYIGNENEYFILIYTYVCYTFSPWGI